MSAEDRQRRPYVESPVIMTTVRVLSPFVMTYGLFVMFHGADSSGGGFQGGTIVAAMVIMLAFAYGIQPTTRWLSNNVLIGLGGIGVLTFVGIGLGAILLGGAFLEYVRYGGVTAAKYGIELVELSIGAIVASVLVGLFFAIVNGFEFQWGEDE